MTDSYQVEAAYVWPEHVMHGSENIKRDEEKIKFLLLLFDKVVQLLLPDQVEYIQTDAQLGLPLLNANILIPLNPAELVDEEMATCLNQSLNKIIHSSALEQLIASQNPSIDTRQFARMVSYKRLGYDVAPELVQENVRALALRGLVEGYDNHVEQFASHSYLHVHPVIKDVLGLLISEGVRGAGLRRGDLDLHPVGFLNPYSLQRPYESVSVPELALLESQLVLPPLDLIPLDELIDFRTMHGEELRVYMRNLRKFVLEISATEIGNRDQLLKLRKEELLEIVSKTSRDSRKEWKVKAMVCTITGMGAAWSLHQGNDLLGALLSMASGVTGAAASNSSENGPFRYLISAQDAFIR